MSTVSSKARGEVVVHEDECKGCALCVESCPVHGLALSHGRLNRLGYHPVEFLDCACTGCGVCFYACPEPGALYVLRHRPSGSAGPAGPVPHPLPDGASQAPVGAASSTIATTSNVIPASFREGGGAP